MDFDEITKALAQSISRRETLKLLAASVLAAMLSPWDGGLALAAPDINDCRGVPGSSCGVQCCPSCQTCGPGGLCGGGCYCFPVGNDLNRTKCGQNGYCDSLHICNQQSDCPRGTFCSLTCCGPQMVCVPKCHPPLPTSGGASRKRPGGGLTAAGPVM